MRKKVYIIHKVSTLDARSFYKESRSLQKAGYDISFLSQYEGKEIKDSIRIIGFHSPVSRWQRFSMTNYQIFRQAIKGRAQIYHFHDVDFVPWAVLLKILTLSKIIYDRHEAYPEYMLLKTYIPQFFRKMLSVLIYFIEHVAVKFYDAIISNDNYIASEFKHKRNVVIFNFPTLDFFNNETKIPFQKREYDLFYHGSLPHYHFETMMKIAEKLNSSNVKNSWGIMTADTPALTWAKNELKQRKLESNFIFLPFTDYLGVIQHLNKAKIGIIPLPPYEKFFKNIPLKMFEFMGAGLPMVLSDLPPSRQFIDNKNCAVAVEPDNIDAYANAIIFLLNNPEKSILMGEKGKDLVFTNYHWGVEEKKLIKLYRELLCL